MISRTDLGWCGRLLWELTEPYWSAWRWLHGRDTFGYVARVWFPFLAVFAIIALWVWILAVA